MLGLVVSYVFGVFQHINSDLEYWGRYMLAPNEMLPATLEEAAILRTDLRRADAASYVGLMRPRLREIERSMVRYHLEWGSHAPGSDSKRFRDALATLGKSDLLDEELAAMQSVDLSIRRLDASLSQMDDPAVRLRALDEVEELKQALRTLLRMNGEYLALYHGLAVQKLERMRVTLLAFGLSSLLLTVFLGLHIQSAIGPRITKLVKKIHVFQETGEIEASRDRGQDEIAVLSNALDAGLAAISGRDRERERFLGIAAHELKTPLTSIVGYTQAALDHPDPKTRAHALEVVRRQAHRLGRLTQDLLWAASARQGHLAFHPKPIDLTAIVRKTIAELTSDCERFAFDAPANVHLLADEELFSHACWQMLSYALAVTKRGELIEIGVARTGARAIVDVVLPEVSIPLDELERAFSPFEVVQYERGHSRYAVGLYLSREIARLHGGTLRATEGFDLKATLRLELPA